MVVVRLTTYLWSNVALTLRSIAEITNNIVFHFLEWIFHGVVADLKTKPEAS